jgi:hypothetical protein
MILAVYFVQPTGGGPIKIGHSSDVPARIKQLEAHYGVPLAVLATMGGGREEERAVHERFAHLRFSRNGGRGGQPEQFRPAADLMAFIGLPLLASANPEAIESLAPIVPGALAIRGNAGWSRWIRGLSFRCRCRPPELIDRALTELARREGFEEPPSRL